MPTWLLNPRPSAPNIIACGCDARWLFAEFSVHNPYQWSFFQNWLFLLGYFDPDFFMFFIVKINQYRGDLSDISVIKSSLILMCSVGYASHIPRLIIQLPSSTYLASKWLSQWMPVAVCNRFVEQLLSNAVLSTIFQTWHFVNRRVLGQPSEWRLRLIQF